MFPEVDPRHPMMPPKFCFVIIMELGDECLDAEMEKRKKMGRNFSEQEIHAIILQLISVLSCL
jgi:hypothetical protein